jgi:ABC-2 type transport system ATP-binding protein
MFPSFTVSPRWDCALHEKSLKSQLSVFLLKVNAIFAAFINNASTMSIIVNNVSKVFGKQYVLNNVSFEAKKGEIVGFLGPNGAGKTTMMKIITCLIPPTQGDVTVCGLDIWKDSLALREKIGYLSEANPLYYDMYVREFLQFIAGIHHLKEAKAKVADIIEKTGLTPEEHKKIGALSRGYKQRVGIAQALIHDPEVLILDEPTTGLDPNQLVEIRDLIRTYGKDRTVLLSTHIMQEVQAMCDHVIIINKGKIVADAKVSELPQMADKMGLRHSSELNVPEMERLFQALTSQD